MQLFLTRVPHIIQTCFSQLIWSQESANPLLTFDDGPHPDSTPWILDYLEDRNQRAIFFVLGTNVERYPQLLQEIKNRGHQIGNHGYEHLYGWKLSVDQFYKNVQKGALLSQSKLFRPPYGQIGCRQFRSIRSEHRVMMWSVMPGDFVKRIDIEKRMKVINHGMRDEDIVVFHDNPKHIDVTKEMLSMLALHFDASSIG